MKIQWVPVAVVHGCPSSGFNLFTLQQESRSSLTKLGLPVTRPTDRVWSIKASPGGDSAPLIPKVVSATRPTTAILTNPLVISRLWGRRLGE